jgi:allophanate hydrolase subunit 1
LIGHTETVVFDIAREPPALLQPGAAVRFVEVSGAGDDR